MPASDFLQVIDSLIPHVNPADITIAITGGEPLLRKDLESVGKSLYERGFPWGIVTNCILLTTERYRSLLNAGLRTISISLDGMKESHEWMRQHPGAFDKALHGIAMAVSTPGLVFDVITCVYQKNIDELRQMKELLISLKVKQWRLFTVFSKGRGATTPEMKLTAEQVVTMLAFIEETRREGVIEVSNNCEGFIGKYEFTNRSTPFECSAGVRVASVLIDGSISACPSLRGDYVQGNIYNDSFVDVWENRYLRMRNRKWTKTGDCADCPDYRYCEGGPLHLRDEKCGELLHCHNRMLSSLH